MVIKAAEGQSIAADVHNLPGSSTGDDEEVHLSGAVIFSSFPEVQWGGSCLCNELIHFFLQRMC